MPLEFRDYVSIASLLLFPLLVFAMRSFVDSLKKELQLTLNTQLDQLKDRFERDFVAKDIWLQQNTFVGDKWTRIETRIEDIGRNVHQYNDTVLRAILNMERENRDERVRVERRENNSSGRD